MTKLNSKGRNQQQQQNNFSIDEDTIDVYDTVEIYESNNINLSNMYDGSYKVYLAILVTYIHLVSCY